LTVNPAGSGGALTAAQVLGGGHAGTWLELASAAGSLFEIFELDLSGIPVDAFFVSASVEFAHWCEVRDGIRVRLVGIRADGSISLGADPGEYFAEPLGLYEAEYGPTVTELGGVALSEFPRLGIAIQSSQRHPALTSHQLYWAQVFLGYEMGRPVISGLTGPATPGAPITWAYSSSTGLPQAQYELMVIAGSNQDPTKATAGLSALHATGGQIIYSSGVTPGPLVRSVVLADAPLGRGPSTVALRVWAEMPSGVLIPSVWATANFDIAGAAPAGPTSPVAPTFNSAKGGVEAVVTPPAGVTRAFLARSLDAGQSWAVAGPITQRNLTTDDVQVLDSTILFYSRPGLPDGVDVSTFLMEWQYGNGLGPWSPNADGSASDGYYYPNVPAGSSPGQYASYLFARDADGTPYLETRITDAYTGTSPQHASQLWRMYDRFRHPWGEGDPFPADAYFSWDMFFPEAIKFDNILGGNYGYTNQIQWFSHGGSPLFVMGAGWNTTNDTFFRWHTAGSGVNGGTELSLIGGPKPVPVGKWFRMEVRFKRSTAADGRVEVWQDGVKIIDYTGITTGAWSGQVDTSWGNYGYLLIPSDPRVRYRRVRVSTTAVTPLLGSWKLLDYAAPLMVPAAQFAVSFDSGPMTETSAPVLLGGPISTVAADWFLIVPDAPELSTRIEVADVQMSKGKRSVTAEQAGASITATSRPLAQRVSLKIRTRSKAERLAVDAALDSGLALRLVDVFGREWLVRPTSGTDDQIQRWQPIPPEITGLRDGHILSVNLVEVRR
jgi:hypothetical protein